MAGRPTKQGLDYFPLDVDFFTDEKVEFVSARFGVKGEVIALRLLCKIYRIGYYTDWNSDECTLFAKRAGDGITTSLVNEVVKELVKRRFFDESLFNRFSILTSRGIQKRYIRAASDRLEIDVNRDFWLVELPKNAIVPNSPPINSISSGINPISPQINTQRRVKENREQKSRENRDNKLSLSDAPSANAPDEERDRILKIFFFKNFLNPSNELERFWNHYAALGWTRKGYPITDKVALAKSWTQEQKERQRFPEEIFAMVKKLHDALHATNHEGAARFVRELVQVQVFNGSVWFGTQSQVLCDLLNANIELLHTLAAKWVPGNGVRVKQMDIFAQP